MTEQVQFRAAPGSQTETTASPGGTSATEAGGADGVRTAAADGVASAGGPLPHLATIQALFGAHDVSGVRAHTGAAARHASAAIGAEAYAVGNDIAFGSAPSLHTAAHEAAHVVQQREGVQLKGGIGEAGDRYEQHADRVADAVIAGRSAEPILDETAGRGGGGGVVAVQKFDRHHATGPAGEGPNTVAGDGATQTDAKYQTYAQIGAGKISDFIQYADKQADWSMKITDDTQRADLRTLMIWLRAGDHRQTALNGFLVSDVVAVKADLPALDAYARARGTSTVLVGTVATVAGARAVGLDVLKLEGALQQVVLHQIFPTVIFEELRTAGKLDDFVRYVKTCSPLLQANNGVEIESFLALAQKADPSSFKDVKDVRNYHRFQAEALTALRGAQSGNPGNKPFTLILHSALDHNGAFHQDPELTATITAASNHTIMIEGAESLDAISARLPAIVGLHGRDEPDPKNATKKVKRIDQVMFAGHGSAHSIELAGTLATDKAGKVKTDGDGELQISDDNLNLHSDPKDPASVARATRTKAFMKQVMGLMSQDPTTPHGRIVFNACLTASNEIDPSKIDSKAGPDSQAKAMRAEIQKAPSLVTAMRQIATDEGRNVDVRGGNGSFGRVGLVDSTGGLDIVADGTAPAGPAFARTGDPELTNPDKLIYVEKGADPQGCMSAVAESWAKDRTKAIDAVKRRRGAPRSTDWDEMVIQAMYELVETRYAANGAGIALLASITDGFKELASEAQSRVWPIWQLSDNADWTLLETRLGAHADWTGQPFVPLVFYHGWMFQNAAKAAKFLGALGAMTVRTSKDFLYMASLYPKWPTLVPAKSPNPPDGGRLRLALRDIVDAPKAPQPHTKTFLASLVTGGAFVVDVNTPLDSLSTDDSVLRTLGLHPSQAAGAGKSKADPKSPPPDANVDMDDDGKNESAVESMSATGRVTADQLYVRDQPTIRGKNHAKLLHKDDDVHIMGQTGTWYLLDHDGARGYASKRYIELR